MTATNTRSTSNSRRHARRAKLAAMRYSVPCGETTCHLRVSAPPHQPTIRYCETHVDTPIERERARQRAKAARAARRRLKARALLPCQ